MFLPTSQAKKLKLQKKRTKWKRQFRRIGSSSLFHETVRKIFVEDTFFKNLSCYQEVPVVDLVDGYSNGRHHVDWYIDELNTVLELHGEQHYAMVNYGNLPFGDAARSFKQIQQRDQQKKQALIIAGYEYREISFKEKKRINAELLKQIIFYDEL